MKILKEDVDNGYEIVVTYASGDKESFPVYPAHNGSNNPMMSLMAVGALISNTARERIIDVEMFDSSGNPVDIITRR